DVVTALAGRRGITRSRRRWLFLGAGLTATGAALATSGAWRINATLVLAGLIVAELGLVLCTPAIVGLVARLGRWLPAAPRSARRDPAGTRAAAAPAIRAVRAAVGGSLGVGTVVGGGGGRSRDSYRVLGPPGQVSVVDVSQGRGANIPQPASPRVAAALREIMPVQQIAQVSMPTCPDAPCVVNLRMPAANACPDSDEILQREPTRAEQRAARRDHRCDGIGEDYRYFGVFGSSGMALAVEAEAGPTVVGVPPQDAGAVTAALRSGAVVVNDPRYLDGGRA